MSQVLNGFQREVMEPFGSIGVLRAITRCGLPYGQLQPDDSVYPALEVVINLRHFGSANFQRSGFDSLFCASLRT
jgi:hypothetical protein